VGQKGGINAAGIRLNAKGKKPNIGHPSNRQTKHHNPPAGLVDLNKQLTDMRKV